MYSKKYLSELNPEQRRAVKAPLEHVVVSAGAGTGKTRVISSRAVYLLTRAKVDKPVVLLTYTKRAAQEIIERLSTIKDIDTNKFVVSTFHSWCWSIIKTSPFMNKYADYQINDEIDSESLLTRALKTTGVSLKGPKKELPTKLKRILSYRCNTLKTLTSAIKLRCPEYFNDIDINSIELVRKEYRKLLHVERRLDFEDIINKVAIKVKKDANAVNWLTKKFSTVLMDEAQDTNKLQWKLLRPLSVHIPLFVVGDDAQAIYGFRGAANNSLAHMTKQLNIEDVKKLSLNYRSTQQILNLSNAQISLSKDLEDRNLVSHKGTGTLPQVYTLRDKNDEAHFIANELKRILVKKQTLEHVLILVRTNREIESLQLLFAGHGIPCNVPTNRKNKAYELQRSISTILRLSTKRFSSLNWSTYLNLCKGIGDKTIEKVLPILCKTRSLKKMKTRIETLGLNNSIVEKIFAALHFIKSVRKLEYDPCEAIRLVLKKFTPQLKNMSRNEWSNCEQILQEFAERAHDYPCVEQYLDSIALAPEFAPSDRKKGVSIMTIHGAKGAEAKVCYILNVSPGNYPYYKAKKESEIEEERRIFYVALTRAENKLVLTTRLNAHGQPKNSVNKRKIRYFLSEIQKSNLPRAPLYVTKQPVAYILAMKPA